MRIIGGEFRGRKILPPPSAPARDARPGRGTHVTRPITDRVKQALFDRLTVMQAFGAHTLDVFAGTGSLGLEALSRGADFCTFIEQHRQPASILERNLEALGLSGRAAVLTADALSPHWLRSVAAPRPELVFLDPPYPLSESARDLDRIARVIHALAEATDPAAVLVLRASDRVVPPPAEGWLPPDTHRYGSQAVHFYEKP